MRSLLRMCDWLQDEFEFRVITRNRDLGVRTPYPGHRPGGWYSFGATEVAYLGSPAGAPTPLLARLKEWPPDLLYFHSFLDPSLVVMPLLLRRFGLISRDLPVVVTPRGEFSPGALGIKPLRKALFIQLARGSGLYKDITWAATDAQEETYIRGYWGSAARVGIVPNLPPRADAAALPPRRPKPRGTLRLVFLSRISPMKNLLGVLSALGGVSVPVSLDIYGPQEDPEYWAKCAQTIATLPAAVEVKYRGPAAPENVLEVLSSYDVFLLPSLGENFGHVILEALLAGCPLILSDQTPWRGLAENQVGFDVPLARPEALIAAVERFAGMENSEFQAWSDRARAFGLAYGREGQLLDAARQVLRRALLGKVPLGAG